MLLSDMDVISGLHENLLIIMRSLQDGFQVTSEVEALIHKGNYVYISFEKKMANHNIKGFVFSTKLYKAAKYKALLSSKKWNPEGKASIQLQGAAVNNQEQTTTKQQAPRKITSTISMQRMAIPDKTVCTQP